MSAVTRSVPQNAYIPASSNPYPQQSHGDYHMQQQVANPESYYTNHVAAESPQYRQQRRQNASSDPHQTRSQRQYHASSTQDDYTYDMSSPSSGANAVSSQGYTTISGALPIHTRNQPMPIAQYDGAPVVPTRTSSQQPQSVHLATTASPVSGAGSSRHPRQQTADNHSPGYNPSYGENARDRSRDDSANAPNSSRSRRKNHTSPEQPQRTTSTRDRSHQTSNSIQSRPEAAMSTQAAPAPLIRENSEVINRIVVSDPDVDEDRMQERVAESQPIPVESDINGIAELQPPNDVGPGPQRRQDYSKSSRRKEVQFGDYMLGQTLGEGEFGKVKLGWKKDGSTQVAIKLIRRESVNSNPTRLPKIYREIAILRDLRHPNIVRLHEMVETERQIGIILEYASGGELFDYILNQRYLKDPAARRLFAQLVSGVGYLHKKGIVHRDLKLENLLLDANRNIIITDFGFANTFNPADELTEEIEHNLTNKDFVRKYRLDRLDAHGLRRGDLMQTSCGSPCYAAPELVVSDSLYTGRKVDVWSCGVILYAMLAGYLPFDDDPANPEGDNINLLYKYITTTPLTFPEYVSPHSKDLLKRILVPDPRRRADLFEVARHSWLSEYHHIVSHVTSSTTNVADIANTTVTSELAEQSFLPNRSASVREKTKASSRTPGAALNNNLQTTLENNEQEYTTNSRPQKTTRHTLQPEYVAPETHTARPQVNSYETPAQEVLPSKHTTASPPQSVSLSKPLPQDPPQETQYTPTISAQPIRNNQAPTRADRDVPRSQSAGNYSTTATAPANGIQATRPSTQGSLTTASAPSGTRSDLKLPSRGSYGQPVAPTVATTNAQGRVTQPPRSSKGYNISGPVPHHGAQNSIGQPMSQPMPPPSSFPPQKAHHRRSSTFSNLSEKIFGRGGSSGKKDEANRQKNGRKYPPTAMKDPYPAEPQPRMSTDSRRSFSLGLGKRRSTDLDSQHGEKNSKRGSLLPTSISIGKLFGGNKEHASDNRPTQNGDVDEESRPVTGDMMGQHQNMTSDGQYEAETKSYNFSRLPQAQYRGYAAPGQPVSNDVYGGTGVYSPEPQQQQPSRIPQHRRQDSQTMEQSSPQYNDNADMYGRPSMQQGRQGKGVLTKPRRFNDAYENEGVAAQHGSSGSSGAARRIGDFFRRRGRARAENDYR